MKKKFLLIVGLILMFFSGSLLAQNGSVKGELFNDLGESIPFANVIFFELSSEKMVKAGVSDIDGKYLVEEIPYGSYRMEVSFIGLETAKIQLEIKDKLLDNGRTELKTAGVAIETAVVTAKRALVEVKSDKTVFNVEGTINSSGDDLIGLLRKAPGVVVDNENNISVLGRSGVLVYIDGKRLPLSGDDLSNYLESIPSEQIDKIDIISNPGARYEAEGNAGIIDIRFKKNKNLGTNGVLSGNIAHGKHLRYNLNASANNRSEKLNLFASAGHNNNNGFEQMLFDTYQNGLYMEDDNYTRSYRQGFNWKGGIDYYINENSTIGILYNGGSRSSEYISDNKVFIAAEGNESNIDSVLVAENESLGDKQDHTVNLNYQYIRGKRTLTFDADYGTYRNDALTYQPNLYYDKDLIQVRSSNLTEYESPSQIDIYALKLDYEQDLFGGRLGFGAKYSRVITNNVFRFYDLNSGEKDLLETRSNIFDYDEGVIAGYFNYNIKLSEAIGLNAGVRLEDTYSTGDLTAFDESLEEDPVVQDHTDLFPSLGISYKINKDNFLNVNYGRRINRPDYNVLNPFRSQLSELSFSTGNPFLKPEIVNNLELGYTLKSRYNFKLAYSLTTDKLTRLIQPDEFDPRAGYLSWDNLSTKEVYSLSMSLPFEFTNWWNAYFNVSGSYISNQAEYDDRPIVNVEVWTYGANMQQMFKLPWGLNFELSGWFGGPGVWGGVFMSDANWNLDAGLQKKFLNNQLNLKLSGKDLLYSSGWSGTTNYAGLSSYARGFYDSRRISLSVSYSFGNNKIKTRKRKSGIEAESRRVS